MNLVRISAAKTISRLKQIVVFSRPRTSLAVIVEKNNIVAVDPIKSYSVLFRTLIACDNQND